MVINTYSTWEGIHVPHTALFRLAFVYSAVVFATGCFGGVVRELYIIPRWHLPPCRAKVFEAPFMFIAVVIWAKWLVTHYSIPADHTVTLVVGILALGMMSCMELIGHGLARDRIAADEGPEAGLDGPARALYVFDMLMFGLMPWILKMKG